ncbi:MAG: hypothetical protein DRJ65_16290 [Acidobacteria bacterium]|nr:MAG: hypothetical protein DRJ65_16290 [Acidobacteriota bacterium]
MKLSATAGLSGGLLEDNIKGRHAPIRGLGALWFERRRWPLGPTPPESSVNLQTTGHPKRELRS